MKRTTWLACVWLLCASTAAASSITYQGQLKQGDAVHTGTVPMIFRLWDDPTAGGQLGAAISQNVEVNDGLFQVHLDFAAQFSLGVPLWLEIEIDGETLTPRQWVTAAPLAVHALFGGDGGLWSAEGGGAIGYGDGQVRVGEVIETPAAALNVQNRNPAEAGVYAVGGPAVLGLSQNGRTAIVGISRGFGGVGVVGECEISTKRLQATPAGTTPCAAVRGLAHRDGDFAVEAVSTGDHAFAIFGSAMGESSYGLFMQGGPASRNYLQRTTGIGVQHPNLDYMLHVDGAGTTRGGMLIESGNDFPMQVRIGGLVKMWMHGNGGMAIGGGGVPPDDGLFVDGLVRLGTLANVGSQDLCRNGTTQQVAQCSSSARYKHDIEPLRVAQPLIEKLRPVRFRWIDDGHEDIGLIAEEVAAIEPRLVSYNEDGAIEGVKYRQLAALLVRALQESNRDTNAALAAYDAKIDALRAQLAVERARTEERLARMEAIWLEASALAGRH